MQVFFNARLSTKFSHHRFLSFCKHNLMNLQVQALLNVVSGELEIFNFFFLQNCLFFLLNLCLLKVVGLIVLSWFFLIL